MMKNVKMMKIKNTGYSEYLVSKCYSVEKKKTMYLLFILFVLCAGSPTTFLESLAALLPVSKNAKVSEMYPAFEQEKVDKKGDDERIQSQTLGENGNTGKKVRNPVPNAGVTKLAIKNKSLNQNANQASKTLESRILRLELDLAQMKRNSEPNTNELNKLDKFNKSSTGFETVPKEELENFAERIKLVQIILLKTRKAYDYRTVTLAELKKILGELNSGNIPNRDDGIMYLPGDRPTGIEHDGMSCEGECEDWGIKDKEQNPF